MKKDLTELVFILDKSGSMSGLEKDTIGGFNSLIEKQKEEDGEAIVSTILFNEKSKVIHNRVSLNEVPLLTRKEYYAAGSTALLDAVGSAISHIKRTYELIGESNIPEKTLFVITTDGMENSSKEYSYSMVKMLIEEMKEKNNWEFIFLGANIDVTIEAEKIGICKENAVEYRNVCGGIKLNYECLGKAVSSVRQSKKISSKWREEIDKDIKKSK